MATTVGTREGRQKILEGLWLIGIEPHQIDIDPNLDSAEFLRRLNANGVNDTFIRRAMAGVDWRADEYGGADLRTRIEKWLQAAGYRPDEIDAFRARVTSAGRSNDANFIHQVLTQQFNERTAGAVVHKATGGVGVSGAVWNPFRTDQPPESANLKFGTQGVLITEAERAQDPNAARARTVVPQMTELPQPLTPAQQRQQAAKAGAPAAAAPEAVPGAGTLGGTPAGGYTPDTLPVEEKLTPQQRLARLQASYGWGAAFADIPDVARILNRVANDEITIDEADNLFKATDWYKQTTKAGREWHAFQKTDPADAGKRRQANLDNIVKLAREAGIQNPDMARLSRLNDLTLQFGWTDAEVSRALASEVNYDPEGARTGLLGQMREMTDEWLVPLSDQAMTSWAQSIVGGTKTIDDFREYNRAQAKSLFPGIATALDDPEMNTRTYLDPYTQDTAGLLGINPKDIDWRDPKFMRAFNQIDPKNANQRTVMSRADWQQTLMNDPLYGFDKTVKGQEMKQSLTQGLMSVFGFSDFAT